MAKRAPSAEHRITAHLDRAAALAADLARELARGESDDGVWARMMAEAIVEELEAVRRTRQPLQ